LIQKFQSLLGARCGTNGRNPEDGKDFKILATTQQVLKVALLFLYDLITAGKRVEQLKEAQLAG
jgi:hypothetical protein